MIYDMNEMAQNVYNNLLATSIEKEDDFKINGYTLIAREHDTSLYDLHNKKLRQWYEESYKQYLLKMRLKDLDNWKCFCPIYVMMLTEDEEESLEHVFYVGSTNQKKNRFINGHKATQSLLNPDFNRYNKSIIFFQIIIDYTHDHIDRQIPIEWLKDKVLVEDVIKFIEYILIYIYKPIGNRLGREKMGKETKFRPYNHYYESCKYIRFVTDDEIKYKFINEADRSFWADVQGDLGNINIFDFFENYNFEDINYENSFK